MRFAIAPAFFVLLASSAASAAGPDSAKPTVDIQLFQPAPGANNFFTTESGDINSHLDVSVGLNLDYAHNPLAVQIVKEDGDEDEVGSIVGYRFDANLLAAIGLFDYGELGLVLPLVLQGGQDRKAFGGAGISVGEQLSGFTQGDLRVVPKVQAFRLSDGTFSAAVLGTVIVPSAGGSAYAGENSVVIAPSMALSLRTNLVRAGFNLGYRFRDRTRIEPVAGQVLLTVDDELFAKAAAAFDLNMGQGAPLELVAEIFGHTAANNPFGYKADTELAKKRQAARTSFEVDLGIRWILLDHLVVTAGVGTGITPQGYGQPAPRVFAGLTYYTGVFGVADADRDGVPDSSDECPNKKEDRDGFQDSDGCPDLDNDNDGVLDEDDQCPNDKEDKDGWADRDGCPETDADDDGVLDEKDNCPGEAEDIDGFKDEDGCPDLDNDGDGIADTVDKCPGEAEDMDGFEDVDGCPDPDNDGDGLPDLGDLCPNHAEDMDNVADDDGCPEDNDGDGIPDELDKCPNKAEIYNGVDDEDGCPEKLRIKSLVQVTEEKIEIKEKVFFRSGSAKILSKSFKLLDQVASVLKNFKHLTKIRVEGHTDSSGSRRRNVKLSQDRADAVRQYLIDKGISPNRLEAQGFGPDKPVASNKSRRGKEQNRRVEFVIADQKPIGVDVSDGQTAPVEGAGGGIELEMELEELPPPGDTPSAEPDAETPPESEDQPRKRGKRKGKTGKKAKPAGGEADTGGGIEFEF